MLEYNGKTLIIDAKYYDESLNTNTRYGNKTVHSHNLYQIYTYVKNKDTPVWDSVRNEMFWKEYLKNNETGPLKYASPMEAESLKGFPKTYIEVAEFDCLHDEGRDFAERLKLEDVVTDYYEMKGTCHGYDDVFNSSLVSNAIERRVKWFQSVFS